MSTLKAIIAQKTGVPGDLFGLMMGGKQLQTEERHRLGGIAKDTMITVTAGLRGGSPGAGTDTPSGASVDTLMGEVTGAPGNGRAETLARGGSAGSTETNTARSI